MGRLEGKVAIVTGGARGLGGASAEALAAEGASVVIADMLEDIGEQKAAKLRAEGRKAEFVRLDVRKPEDWAALMQHVKARHKRADILVNNAGITISVTIEEATLEQLHTIFDINLVGPFLGTQAVLPLMKVGGGGSIINIASNATKMTLPQTSLYGATKSAVANLTKTTAVHCANEGYNIRVNSIHPGPHETDMLLGGAEKAADIPQVRAVINAIPMKRMGNPKEIGSVVVFLASDDSSYMTAAELFVDGGLTVV